MRIFRSVSSIYHEIHKTDGKLKHKTVNGENVSKCVCWIMLMFGIDSNRRK